MHAFDAVALLDQREQAVIGEHEILSAFRFCHDCFARAAYRRIDDDDEDRTRRIVRRCAIKKTRAIGNGEWCDLMGEVDDAHFRHDRIHDAAADGDGVVDYSEVGHEHDGLRIVCGLCVRQGGRDEHQQQKNETSLSVIHPAVARWVPLLFCDHGLKEYWGWPRRILNTDPTRRSIVSSIMSCQFIARPQGGFMPDVIPEKYRDLFRSALSPVLAR